MCVCVLFKMKKDFEPDLSLKALDQSIVQAFIYL